MKAGGVSWKRPVSAAPGSSRSTRCSTGTKPCLKSCVTPMQDRSPQLSSLVFPIALQPEVPEQAAVRSESWGWLELFVFSQVLWGVLLFVPGSQAYRTYIRGFPYVASLTALVACSRSGATDTAVP